MPRTPIDSGRGSRAGKPPPRPAAAAAPLRSITFRSNAATVDSPSVESRESPWDKSSEVPARAHGGNRNESIQQEDAVQPNNVRRRGNGSDVITIKEDRKIRRYPKVLNGTNKTPGRYGLDWYGYLLVKRSKNGVDIWKICMIEEMANQWLRDEYVTWWRYCGGPINHAEFCQAIKIKYDVKNEVIEAFWPTRPTTRPDSLLGHLPPNPPEHPFMHSSYIDAPYEQLEGPRYQYPQNQRPWGPNPPPAAHSQLPTAEGQAPEAPLQGYPFPAYQQPPLPPSAGGLGIMGTGHSSYHPHQPYQQQPPASLAGTRQQYMPVYQYHHQQQQPHPYAQPPASHPIYHPYQQHPSGLADFGTGHAYHHHQPQQPQQQNSQNSHMRHFQQQQHDARPLNIQDQPPSAGRDLQTTAVGTKPSVEDEVTDGGTVLSDVELFDAQDDMYDDDSVDLGKGKGDDESYGEEEESEEDYLFQRPTSANRAQAVRLQSRRRRTLKPKTSHQPRDHDLSSEISSDNESVYAIDKGSVAETDLSTSPNASDCMGWSNNDVGEEKDSHYGGDPDNHNYHHATVSRRSRRSAEAAKGGEGDDNGHQPSNQSADSSRGINDVSVAETDLSSRNAAERLDWSNNESHGDDDEKEKNYNYFDNNRECAKRCRAAEAAEDGYGNSTNEDNLYDSQPYSNNSRASGAHRSSADKGLPPSGIKKQSSAKVSSMAQRGITTEAAKEDDSKSSSSGNRDASSAVDGFDNQDDGDNNNNNNSGAQRRRNADPVESEESGDEDNKAAAANDEEEDSPYSGIHDNIHRQDTVSKRRRSAEAAEGEESGDNEATAAADKDNDVSEDVRDEGVDDDDDDDDDAPQTSAVKTKRVRSPPARSPTAQANSPSSPLVIAEDTIELMPAATLEPDRLWAFADDLPLDQVTKLDKSISVRVGQGMFTEYRVCDHRDCGGFLVLESIFEAARNMADSGIITEWTVTLPAHVPQAVADAFPALLDRSYYPEKPLEPDFVVPLLALGSAVLRSDRVAKDCSKALNTYCKDADILVKFCADALRLIKSKDLLDQLAKKILKCIEKQEFDPTSPLVTEASNEGVWLKVLEANATNANGEWIMPQENRPLSSLLSEFIAVKAADGSLTPDIFSMLTKSELLPPPGSESAEEALRLVQLEKRVVGGATDGIGLTSLHITLIKALKASTNSVVNKDCVEEFLRLVRLERVVELTPLQSRLIEALKVSSQSVDKVNLARALKGLPSHVCLEILYEGLAPHNKILTESKEQTTEPTSIASGEGANLASRVEILERQEQVLLKRSTVDAETIRKLQQQLQQRSDELATAQQKVQALGQEKQQALDELSTVQQNLQAVGNPESSVSASHQHEQGQAPPPAMQGYPSRTLDAYQPSPPPSEAGFGISLNAQPALQSDRTQVSNGTHDKENSLGRTRMVARQPAASRPPLAAFNPMAGVASTAQEKLQLQTKPDTAEHLLVMEKQRLEEEPGRLSTKHQSPPAYIEPGNFEERREMKHLPDSPKTLNATAENPRRELSLYDLEDDSIINKFVLVVKQSGIPGANLGAFIKFTGAFRWNGTSKTYKRIDRQTFDGRKIRIDLGNYNRKEDVWKDEPFILKSFIFSNLPREYAFALNTKPQKWADISSNTSGEPHEHAKAQVHMYVNEVGYNSEREQNVYASRIERQKYIRYDFAPNERMRIGEEMELLTHYSEDYERIREQHGYGWQRASFARRLQRNLLDRAEAHKVITDIDTVDVKNSRNVPFLVQVISSKIWAPMYKQICEEKEELKPAQLVGVQRLSWVVGEFQAVVNQKKLERQHGLNLRAGPREQREQNEAQLVEEAESKLRSMEEQIGQAQTMLAAKSREALKDERVEEICYLLAMNEEVCCRVALELFEDLFRAMLDSNSAEDRLTAFYNAGEKAKNAILLCVKEGECGKMEFASGVSAGTNKLSGPLGDILDDVKLQYKTTPKGVRAARFVMVNANESRLDSVGPKEPAALGSKPVDSESTTTGEINAKWYINWQVLYVVDLFASSYCGEAGYELSTLCSKLDANEELARFVAGHSIFQWHQYHARCHETFQGP